MYLVYSKTEFKPGTDLARVYMYDNDGDIIMTVEPMYEDDFYDEESDAGSDCYDGPDDY